MSEPDGLRSGGQTGAGRGTPRSSSCLVIAIDGPVGAGKSSMARRLAEALGCVYVDSGAMYRAIGWKAIRDGVDLTDQARLATLAAATDIRILPGPSGPRVLVDGEDRTHALRTPEIDQAASLVSTCMAVRERLVALQRSMAARTGVVMDGRDIGTVVFPDADLKFFLDADLAVRAERRRRDLERAGTPTAHAAVQEEVARRDARDRGREVSPLRPAADAVRIDSTDLSADEVIQRMLAEVARVLK
jgi:CMP/dCMP kinase